jgi:outer membrane protein OmpA-like peptidoglycan-associated protein
MKMKKILPMLMLLVALVAAPACKKAADLMKYKDQVTALVTKYAPQLEALKPKLAGLLGKADALKNVPGYDKLQGLLGAPQKDAEEASALLAGVPAKIAGIKSADDGTKLVAELGALEGKFTSINGGIAAAEAEVAKLEAAKAAVPPVADGSGSGSGSAAVAVPESMEWMFKLGSGFELKGAKGGIEDSLVAFIEDKTKAIDKNTWFSFDKLTFTSGKSDKSKDQLSNINEILKAYPALKVKIGGYTDSVGKADVNKKISGERAKAVMAALVGMGIAADRLEAEGYGPEHPKCEKPATADAKDVDACNAQNRRIDLSVRAK